jgi:hypothetical protein
VFFLTSDFIKNNKDYSILAYDSVQFSSTTNVLELHVFFETFVPAGRTT